MSEAALSQVTRALQLVLHDALGGSGQPDTTVHIGPPIPGEVGDRPASLFLFHLEPNRELRNAPRVTPTLPGDPIPDDPTRQNALPLDIRYLITVFRRVPPQPGAMVDTNELTRLGEIIAALQAQPTLAGALLPGQEVRVTPEPYPMEEMSRIWGLFPQAPYRTSMVYLATPVFVDAGEVIRGRAVVSRQFDQGSSADPPDFDGRRRDEERRRAALEGLA